jgi:hypothetical protein
VLRNERRNLPRVIIGEGRMDKRSGRPENCGLMTPANVACDLGAGQSSYSMLWNGRDVTVGCTRDGMITVSDAGSGIVASADLRSFEYVARVHAAGMRQDDGREAMALLAQLRATGRREMLLMFDADGRVTYQELIARTADQTGVPLSVCKMDERDSLVVDLGAPASYQAR